MSGTPWRLLRRCAAIESKQTLWRDCRQHLQQSTDSIFMKNTLIEDEKRTSDLHYGEISIWKITKTWYEWNASARAPLLNQNKPSGEIADNIPSNPLIQFSWKTL
jgi:hypothetical protein